MGNIVEKQIVEEGPRNAVVKITGVLDTSDINEVSVIKPLDFSNNDPRAVLKGFRVDTVLYSIGQALDLVLSWNGATPQQITPLARSGKIDVHCDGGFLPDETRTGYDGSLNLVSNGYPAGTIQNFTLTLRLVKLYRQ